MKSEKQIDAELKRLLKIVNNKKSPLESRVAYIVHETIRWTVLNTRGWKRPSEEITANAVRVIDAVREQRGTLLSR